MSQRRLANINEVLDQFKKSPEIAKVIEAINKLGY